MSTDLDVLNDAISAVRRMSPQTRLLVVGAATGSGRWLVDHVLSPHPWSGVTLIDLAARSSTLEEAVAAFGDGVASAVTWDEEPSSAPGPSEAPQWVPGRDLVFLATPDGQLDEVVRKISDTLIIDGTVVVISDRFEEAIAVVSSALPGCRVRGLHFLFDRTAASMHGQSVYVSVPDEDSPDRLEVADLIRGAGGVVTSGTAHQHDQSMVYVQTAAHQTLLNFVDVLTRSGLDLERDLWAARTPLFESLFGLAVRVLDPAQRTAIEGIQSGGAAERAAALLSSSARNTFTSIADPSRTAQRLEEISSQLSGSLFSTAKNVAQVAVTATQATRTELSQHLVAQDIVGLRPHRRPELLHIGRVVDLGTTDVVIEDLLLASSRGAVLATGGGPSNRRRLGARGNVRRVRLNLGQVSVVEGAELDRELDRRLAYLRRDVRFLVPESVSGRGVVRALAGVAATRGHELVSEAVRTGQRAVVVRVEVRADKDVDEMVEHLRSIIHDIYAWPDGICLPAHPGTTRVHFLGPPGTFSEAAAKLCAHAAGLVRPTLQPSDGFEQVLGRLTDDSIAVLPISSSSSGLVTRAFTALWNSDRELVVGGMVDVSVRFDAYIPAGSRLEDLRGATLFSHPQAIAQCQQFIARWGLVPVPCSSTAEALQLLDSAPEPSVALSAAGADLRDLRVKVGEREVDDLSGSITRFLIVGLAGAFGDLAADFVPTTRSIFMIKTAGEREPSLPLPSAATYEEILGDADGNHLLVTSRSDLAPHPALRKLGTTPWSPRTPVVRVQG